MEIKRFRNHYTSVLEKVATITVTFFAIVVLNLGEEITIKDTEAMMTGLRNIIYLLVGIGIFLLVIGIIIGILSWIWAKTWIVLEENAISVEKNTLMFSKNTLGIKDISNVNLEQNLFEIIVGTSKVKINTNSFSTASSTDIKIVLKKKDAEALKNYLNERINQLNQSDSVVTEEKTEETKPSFAVKASSKDIFLNSIFSTNIIASVIIAMVSCGFLVNLINFIFGEAAIDNLLYEYLSITVAVFGIIVFTVAVLIYNCVRSYVKMYNFSVGRNADKITIKYGMLKQIEFSVPVDKINAIVIHQTLIARLFKKYSAEMVNVGMGDEKEEDTYFCLYASKKQLVETINNVLPEFSDALNVKIERQPKAAILMKTIGVTISMIILGAVGAVVDHFVDDALIYIVAALAVIFILLIVLSVLGYILEGVGISDNYCCIRAGAMATKNTIVKFDKIQYITANKNVLTSKLGIVVGRINILAMQGKNMEIIPYIKEEKFKEISEKLIK